MILRNASLALLLASSSALAQQAVAPVATDHAGVVGHYGATWFAPVSLSTLGSGNNDFATFSVTPVGVRYWMNSGMGLDLGVGLAFRSGSEETVNGNRTTTVEGPRAFGMVLHGGLPLALSTGKHYTFLAVPELNLGFSNTTQKGDANDTTVNGFRLDLGARAGAEIHFGFIDLPQLSLQATVGAAFAYDSASREVGNDKVTASNTSFGTTVQNEPWSIFRSNVAAIYYF
jgi:hypothetical protein